MAHLLQIYGWLSSQWGNILAGIVASLMVLALQTVTRAVSLAFAAWLTVRWRMRLLWSLRKPTRIYVVSGAITGVSEEVKSVVLAGPDAEAASTLIAAAGLLYPDAEVRHVYASVLARELYKEHLVIVGGPINNSCCAAVLEQISAHVAFEDFTLVASDMRCETSYDEHGNAVTDHGAIIRIPNPFDKSKDVVLAVGCDTHGVLAASTLLSTRPEAKQARAGLLKRLGLRRYFATQNFVAVVECDVLGNDIGDIRLKNVVRLKGALGRLRRVSTE